MGVETPSCNARCPDVDRRVQAPDHQKRFHCINLSIVKWDPFSEKSEDGRREQFEHLEEPSVGASFQVSAQDFLLSANDLHQAESCEYTRQDLLMVFEGQYHHDRGNRPRKRLENKETSKHGRRGWETVTRLRGHVNVDFASTRRALFTT